MRAYLTCAAALLAIAGSSLRAEPAAPKAEDPVLSCWKQIDDGYYSTTPRQIVAGLDALEARKDKADPGTYAYVRAYGLFRLASISSRKDQAQSRLEEADRLLAKPGRPELAAEFHALRSGIDGQLAGMGDMELTIRYGMASGTEAESALSQDRANGRALFAQAVAKANTPAEYGGSLEDGIQGLQDAVASFGRHPAAGIFAWGEADADAWLGILYLRQKDPQKAKAAFEAALKVRPDFYWVSDNLMMKMEGKPVHRKFPKGQPTD